MKPKNHLPLSKRWGYPLTNGVEAGLNAAVLLVRLVLIALVLIVMYAAGSAVCDYIQSQPKPHYDTFRQAAKEIRHH